MKFYYGTDGPLLEPYHNIKSLELKIHSGLIDRTTLNELLNGFIYITNCYNIVVRSIKKYDIEMIDRIYAKYKSEDGAYTRTMLMLINLRKRLYTNASKKEISKHVGEPPKFIYAESVLRVIDMAMCKYIGYLANKHSLSNEYIPDIYSGVFEIHRTDNFDELTDCNDLGIQKYFSSIYIKHRPTKSPRISIDSKESYLHIKGLGSVLVYMYDSKNIIQYVLNNLTSFTIKMKQFNTNGRCWKEFSIVMSYKFSKKDVPEWVNPLYTAPIILSIDIMNLCSIVSPISTINTIGGSPKTKIVKLKTFDNVANLISSEYHNHSQLIDVLIRKGLTYNSIPDKFFREPYDEDETLGLLNHIKRLIHDDIMKMLCDYPVGIIVATIPEDKVLDEYFPIFNVMAYKLICHYLKIYCNDHYIKYVTCKVKEAEFFECNRCKEYGKTWIVANSADIDEPKYSIRCNVCGMNSPITRNFLYNIKEHIDSEIYEKCPPGFINHKSKH